jgi:DNA-binding NtrC family response regulator
MALLDKYAMRTSMKVLIAEDDFDVARTLEAMLGAMGHSAQIALTFEDAMRARHQQAFQAYVIDLGFADCGGPALLGSLRREDGNGPRARAVGWTGAADLWSDSRAAALFDAVVAKPASLRLLMAALEGGECPTCARQLNGGHLLSDCQLPASPARQTSG